MIDTYEIKLKLIEQSVKRLLDAHLGTYIFEEGEIVELWEPDALEIAARRIAQYNIDNSNDYYEYYESDWDSEEE